MQRRINLTTSCFKHCKLYNKRFVYYIALTKRNHSNTFKLNKKLISKNTVKVYKSSILITNNKLKSLKKNLKILETL